MSVTSKDTSVWCTSSSGPYESELVLMRQNSLQRGREERVIDPRTCCCCDIKRAVPIQRENGACSQDLLPERGAGV